MSAWAGLRPLVRDPNKKDTKSLARNHIIEVLISLTNNDLAFVVELLFVDL